jgi:cellulose synthase/poly-beta-1,6-N-acetylglucosamine synthase-like glycosyltransferase
VSKGIASNRAEWQADSDAATTPAVGAFPFLRAEPLADGAVLSSRQIAELVFPELSSWKGVLERLGISFHDAVAVAARADAGRWSLGQELVAERLASDADVCRAVAQELDLPFAGEVDPGRLLVTEEEAIRLLRGEGRGLAVRQEGRAGRSTILLSPLGWNPADFGRHLQIQPALRRRLRIVPCQALRDALWVRARSRLAREAALRLSDRRPQMSARFVLAGWQGAVVGMVLAALPMAFLLAPAQMFLLVHVLASVFFLSCVILRICASCAPPPQPAARIVQGEDEADLPVYSVLVALYREKEVASGLVKALQARDWPAGRLEIKLVCEADDRATIEALRAESLPPFMELVEVPPALPRTKPKALNFALPATKGDFVVLYDAEDRPDPLQLREAFQRFSAAGPDLGCLQAPLVVSNRSASLVARMFSAEYRALFRGLLPYLARRSAFLPLGGTSNHFRRVALEEADAWDSFNVTEDADLGLRLARLGFRTDTLTRPTLEDGPEDWKTWLPQRTRWFKGWALTWLVHMREPLVLLRDLGWPSFLLAQILLVGMVASSLVHPLVLLTAGTLVMALAAGQTLSPLQSGLMLVDVANIALGYLSFWLLARHGSTKEERRGLGRVATALPLYWLMLSLAAWKALWQLWKRPHHWSKTPHRPARA